MVSAFGKTRTSDAKLLKRMQTNVESSNTRDDISVSLKK